jgi:hypothetical protein
MESTAAIAPASTEPDVVSAVNVKRFAVQVRYHRSDWVTVATLGHRRAALRAAAAAYRDAISPDGWSPHQVRLLEV